jgi:hypothetical protein
MKINDGYMVFEWLEQPSRDVIGEHTQIKAKISQFSQFNAPGDPCEIADFSAVIDLARRDSVIFAALA